MEESGQLWAGTRGGKAGGGASVHPECRQVPGPSGATTGFGLQLLVGGSVTPGSLEPHIPLYFGGDDTSRVEKFECENMGVLVFCCCHTFSVP